eukprot:6192732-Pleurochrysis_carterae.AAC.1
MCRREHVRECASLSIAALRIRRCAAWRREVVTQLGFDPSMRTEDIDLSIRALAAGYVIEIVPQASSAHGIPNPTIATMMLLRRYLPSHGTLTRCALPVQTALLSAIRVRT